MKDKFKVIGILIFAGFSFFYTSKVSTIIKNNDPIMKEINSVKEDMVVSKIDRIVMDDEYIAGKNGCIVDEQNSYNKMKNEGSFKEELLVMKEDKVSKIDNAYIIGGNKENRNVSIILLNINDSLDNYIKKNKIKVNYFLDGNYIIKNIDKIIKISKYSNIYNYGRNSKYLSKYIVYDNTIIESNLNNKSTYCLVGEKNNDYLKLCNSYKMGVIKGDFIKDDILTYTKENLSNGKIFIYDSKDYGEMTISLKYILSKGYKIVSLDELLDETNKCN